MDRAVCERLDRDCPLAPFRERFALPEGLLYFDGNSLGALPKSTAADIGRVVREEWGRGLVESWLDADWFFLARQTGDAIAPLIGASAGEVVCADSTSVNLFKLAASLLRHSEGRRTVVTERGNFPTDVYILEGLIDLSDGKFDLVLAEPETIVGAIDGDTALVLLSHVNFRTGAMHDMAAITAHCTAHGVPAIWDLSHSAGAVPLALNRWGVEYAVGCTYKFLNGGPGAPAYVYMAQDVIAAYEPVVTGWFSHANQFGFEDRYRSTAGIEKCLVGTPPILSLRAVMHGIACFDGVDLDDVVQKSRTLSELLIDLADERLAHAGFVLASPREPARRGSQVSFRHPEAYAVSKALRAAGVVADFRSPDILRFGIAPLYMRYVDVWDAVDALARIMASGGWMAHSTDAPEAVT
ncbi:MAG: kynureninase [Rhodospirillales bacterium]|nr:kynureninase [Rhodospirillales bacterium]